MLEAIKAFFQGSMEVPEEGEEEGGGVEKARLAACALLLELAYADDEFTDSERAHLEGSIRRQFGLDEARAAELVELARTERKEAVDLFQFTRLIDREFTLGQKLVLAEALWGLAYADGSLSSREDYLVRKVSNLLHLKPGYLTEARDRVRKRRRFRKEGSGEAP